MSIIIDNNNQEGGGAITFIESLLHKMHCLHTF